MELMELMVHFNRNLMLRKDDCIVYCESLLSVSKGRPHKGVAT